MATPIRPANAAADPALRRAYQRAVAAIHDARTKEMTDFDKLYEAVGTVIDSDPPLYLAAGLKTARDFLAKEIPGVDERTVRMNVKVARHFDPAHEETFGLVRLALLVDYLALANKGKAPAGRIDPARAKVRVPVGKTSKLAPFAKCDVSVMRDVVRYAKGGRSAIQAESDAATPLVKRLRGALAKAGFSNVTVSERSGKVRLGAIDAKRLGEVARVIASI